MTPEQCLDKDIMIYCGEHNAMCFHINVGKIKFFDIKMKKYRLFDTGVPPGYPDLTILTNKGQIIFCETKIHPRKPTDEQVKFISNLNKRGFVAFVAYSLEEFIENTKNVIW